MSKSSLIANVLFVIASDALALKNEKDQANNFEETTMVVNTLSCSSCSDSSEEVKPLYYNWYDEIPTYAKLAEDTYPTLPLSFTICLDVSTTMNHGQQVFFTIKGIEEKPFLGLAFADFEGNLNSILLLIIGSTWLPMPVIYVLPNQWILNCLSISFETRMIEWVLDGEVMVSTNMSENLRVPSEEAERNRPSNLSGKILLGVIETPSGWVSPGNKVTNLNIFSSALPLETMIRITKPGGENCGKKGDFLQWENMKWSLYGQAIIENVDKNELRRVDPTTYVYHAEFATWKDCVQHCDIFGGRLPKIVTLEEKKKMNRFLKKFYALFPYQLGGYWLSLTDYIEEGIWRDYITNETLQYNGPFAGGEPSNFPTEDYVWETAGGDWIDNIGTAPGFGMVCICDHEQVPRLKLRGACQKSKIGLTYSPQNFRQGRNALRYLSSKGTVLQYVDISEAWLMFQYDGSFLISLGQSEGSEGRFLLGKHNWTIVNDTQSCSKGKPYTTQLKLTGCDESDQFTCSDGQCVSMDQRCNQIPDCRDESDEMQCNILVLREGYNKNVPPVTSGKEKVNVSISINVLKLVDINEEDYSIEIQFSITMEWLEKRAIYHNLKRELFLNALTDANIKQLWLPKVIYENTRLGEYGKGEWDTHVVVARQQEVPQRSDNHIVDEIEIFSGANNSLIMSQTYTHDFQCNYEFGMYPFDKQVNDKIEFLDHSLRLLLFL